MYTSHHPCWDAKNRYGLEDELSFNYSEIAHIISSNKQGSVPVKEYTKEEKQQDFMNIPDGVPEQLEFDTSPEEKAEPKKTEQKASGVPKDSVFHVSEKIPKALRDLMEDKLVSEEEIQKVVGDRGYYPQKTPIENYDPDFISGVLVGAWAQVYGMIQKLRETYEVPF